MRALSEPTRSLLHNEVGRVCRNVAAGYGCTADVEIQNGYPVTMNDDVIGPHVVQLAAEVLGEDFALPMESPLMGAEDFSYVLQRVPGALAFVGGRPPDVQPELAAPNHSNRAVFDEAAMAHGVAMYAAFALDTLGKR
jgi:metal-dependent amidase/aminoacylase/carboxypeptidase family protein